MKTLDYLQLLVLAAIHVAKGAFIEIPKSQTVSVGETADFRCTHATADNILWRINGSLVSIRQLPPGITISASSEGSILTVIGQSEYDGTEVVCVATFFNGAPDDTTDPPAMLRVVMTPSETDMVSGTRFDEEPLSLNVTIGEEAVFRCEHRSADAISWRINGTSLTNRPDLHDDFIDDNIGRLNTLTVPALCKYNATMVQCVALFDSATIQPVSTPHSLLQIQGILPVANELKKQNSTLSWKAPFSLNLTNVEPDIVYCVDVYNITCGRGELLISDCDVTETSYTSDVIAPDGYIYEYIVTPRSNVDGAINGTPSQPVRDHLPTFNESSTRLSVGNFGQDSNVRAYKTELLYSSNDPIPSSYSLSLHSLDGLKDMDHVETTATIEPSVLTLEVVSGLPFRRLWNSTVLAYGCQENNILNKELSTHDFRDILSSSLHPGVVRVTGSFTDDSTATGVLVIVIGDSKVIYHKASRDGTDKIKETLVTGLAGGEYGISVFVVEENGLPFERVATSPKLVAVETNDVVTPPSSSIEYSLQSTSTGVCITCTFLDSSATDCVAVVHQRISQLSSSGLMNIKRHKLTRSNDTASGCIEGVNLQIGVIGGVLVTEEINPTVDTMTNGSGLANSNIIVIVGGVLAGVIVVSLVVVIIIFVIIVKNFGREKPRSRSPSPSPESPLPRPTTLGNTYESVSPLGTGAAGVHEGTPLFRVQSDGPTTQRSDESAHAHDATPTSTSPPPYSPPEGDSTLPPPVPPPRTKEDPNVVAYAETVVSKCSTAPPPTEMDKVVYHEVGGTLNAQGQHYTLISDLPTRTSVIPDDLHRTVYSEIKPQDPSSCQVTIAEKNGSEKHSSLTREDKSSTPFSLEHILPEVMPMASKWLALGEALSLDEDRLDEIFTNNETDEACLNVMLEFYMERSNHSWEEIETAMRKVREKDEVMDTSTKDSSPPIPPRDITGQMLYHSNLSPHNNEDYKSSFEEKIVQSDDSCRVDKDGGQFTSGRHETTTVHSVPEKSPVNDDRSCQVTCCCSEESFRPLQRALQQPLTFTSSVQQDAKDSGLNDPNTHQPVVPDQCHNDHESFQQKCDREEKDEGYSSSTLDSSEDSSYPESECVLPIQETEQGHPLEQLIVQGPLVMLQPESLDHLRCHDKQSIECEQLHNIVSVQIHQH